MSWQCLLLVDTIYYYLVKKKIKIGHCSCNAVQNLAFHVHIQHYLLITEMQGFFSIRAIFLEQVLQDFLRKFQMTFLKT